MENLNSTSELSSTCVEKNLILIILYSRLSKKTPTKPTKLYLYILKPQVSLLQILSVGPHLIIVSTLKPSASFSTNQYNEKGSSAKSVSC